MLTTHSLSDKQQKLAEKVRKRENRIAALQREVDKIRVRFLPPCMLPQRLSNLHCADSVAYASALPGSECSKICVPCMQAKQTAMEEMTQGQAATLVRNEQIIDQAAEEMDDLEEMLNESISDSMRSTKEKAAGQGKQHKKRC